MRPADKGEYGVDAPGAIRNLLLAGVAGIVLALFGPKAIQLGAVRVELGATGWGIGVSCLMGGLLMLLYSLKGKFAHRDRMLALHPWRGDEEVLDVGTGRGLLLVGAARRLTTGCATGLDIWNRKDLSGNSLERTQKNLAAEGVAEKCRLVSERAEAMSAASGSFDVVLSNLCLHNIYDKSMRRKACQEIARVLKPGGVAILSDMKLTGEYAKVLRESGLQVKLGPRHFLTTYPPLRILLARKGLPGASSETF